MNASFYQLVIRISEKRAEQTGMLLLTVSRKAWVFFDCFFFFFFLIFFWGGGGVLIGKGMQ